MNEHEYVAVIRSVWVSPEGTKVGVKFRRFTAPHEGDYKSNSSRDANAYYLREVDFTSELLLVVPAEEWLGEWVVKSESEKRLDLTFEDRLAQDF